MLKAGVAFLDFVERLPITGSAWRTRRAFCLKTVKVFTL